MTDYKKDLIQYRLERARESLRDAEILFENEGSPVSVVNRAYYSIFYRLWHYLLLPTSNRRNTVECWQNLTRFSFGTGCSQKK